MPRPLACRMMSSAWSQGTSFRRSVTRAGDRVGRDDVEVGEVGDHLQQRAHFDVLEVQRELLAGEARALRQLGGIDLLLAHLDDELVVALVGAVFPRAARLDHHADPVAGLERRDRLHRRAEVGHVEAPPQALGQRGLQEFDHQRSGPAGGCRRRPGCWAGPRRSAAGAVAAAAEVQVLDRLRVAIAALGETGACGGRRRRRLRTGSSITSSDLSCELRLVGGCAASGSAPAGCGRRPAPR